ncbi:hypothetical protein XF_2076 [Xylella fastidiosa 9a5c]|uniref:Uncharacterized protein n=1 Tax=Xylella fastidiosa (strain 9a5c) TaxID=160492 RepID=Q9PBR4_XYLFA|nr:hypothetical protein XF_2076 [Xylella fastidiosa 9a5c]
MSWSAFSQLSFQMRPTDSMGTIMIKRLQAALKFLKLRHQQLCLCFAQTVPKARR